MSLAIDTNAVTRVLLSDGWHRIEDNSFDLDSYEFVAEDTRPEHRTAPKTLFGRAASALICSTGFEFVENGERVCGPLTAILAVACKG